MKNYNLGISAHVDSGKTTLTERILFYTNRIHTIHDVKGKDGVGALMDSMVLEKERGITIASAATSCSWNQHELNIIDTPGHVDFQIEVERSLRVLDGAILVLCAVSGVQSQSLTVDRQMKRYNVPCLAFINKCDRSGSDPFRIIEQLREKLNHNAVTVQLPIGLESKHEGVVDLVVMKAVYFDGANGEVVRVEDIPADLVGKAEEYREILIDAASMFSEDLMEEALEGEVKSETLIEAIKIGTLTRELTPVLMGSAYKNKGIQSLLDAVTNYLPQPKEIKNIALDLDNNEEEVILQNKDNKGLVSLAFKLEDGKYGQLTYIRVYQGKINKGDFIYNTRTGKKVKVGRLVKMHSDTMEDVEYLGVGQIGALFGIDCSSGDTFCNKILNYSMTSMVIPKPVISVRVTPKDNKAQMNMSKAIARFTKEDPTFQVRLDPETGDTIFSGMGELHLEIYVERMKREYEAEVMIGKPQVAYRETITKKAEFNYTHKKQTGGSGQFGRVAGFIEPLEGDDFEFVNDIHGGSIPSEFISSCEKGFKLAMQDGPQVHFPIVGVRATINDGSSHAVDSSDMAFTQAAIGAFKEGFKKAKPTILEPIMKVEIETPSEFQGQAIGVLNQKRGRIVGTQDEGNMCVIEAHVPLSEMFGFSTVLRSLTQGKAEFTMEPHSYSEVPKNIKEELIEKNK